MNELELREPAWVALQSPAMQLAQTVADTAFVPKGIRGNPPAIAAAILFGAEVGLGPMQSLSRIAVIDGRPSLAAEAQRALILRAGHELWIVESSNTSVTIAGRRAGTERVVTVTWTLDDAKRAGLSGKPNWRQYPRAMLTARASAELARVLFADAIGGLAATEEIEGDAVGDAPALDAALDERAAETPAAPPGRARRRAAPATAETSGRPAAPESARADIEPPLPDEPLEQQATLDQALGEPGLAAELVEPYAEVVDPAAAATDALIAKAAALDEQQAALDAEPSRLADQAAAAAAEPEQISGPQRRKMNALFRELDVTDRGARLAYCSKVADRKIGSSNELTIREAALVIDALEDWQKNPAAGPFGDSIPYI